MNMAVSVDKEPGNEAHRNAERSALKENYLEMMSFVERMHRLLLDVIKDDFERLGRNDINAVQALLLFNIGDSDLTAGELRTRGYYQGSNVSYNLKKLVDMGYIHHQRSQTDRRSVRVSLTEKGMEIRGIVAELFDKHVDMIQERELMRSGDVADLNEAFRDFERFWTEQIRYRY